MVEVFSTPWLPNFPSGSGFKEYPSFVGAMVARSAPSMARSDERNTPSGLVSRAGSARGSVVSSCVESANDTGCLEAVRVFLNFLNQRGILFRDGSAEEASRRFLAPLLFRLTRRALVEGQNTTLSSGVFRVSPARDNIHTLTRSSPVSSANDPMNPAGSIPPSGFPPPPRSTTSTSTCSPVEAEIHKGGLRYSNEREF